MGEKPRRAQKIALLALVALGLLAAQQLGVLRALSEPEQLRTWIVERGAFGQLAFVVAFALLQPFGVPGTIFVLVAPILWPWPEAFALSMTGTMAASVIGFSFSRFIARDWVAARVPERFKRYEAALERRAFLTVATLRFLLWMPQALHAFFGVSRVPFWTHFWGSLVGYTLPLLATAFFGERLFEWFADIPAQVWGVVGLALVVLVLLGGFLRWCAVNREARAATTSSPQ
ncbi:MAG: TVP38/TMEM64 family protein [Sandaracinaceae bacterium]|nr:TVP38/TMEM64 family protein [Myxococcales bacterium]MCB9660442.1 TVP38/TMEM64 family protein [Sandaracinaceae bacterium]